MPATIKTIMEPKSIAVIGATDRVGSVGRAVVTNIIEGGFSGVLYPVNPRARSVVSNRAFPSIKDIPDDVDMAVVIVPAPMVVDVVQQAADKGVSGVVVITAGFKEVGGEGVKLENELKQVVKERGIRLIGPNCLGIINTAPGLQHERQLRPGHACSGQYRVHLPVRRHVHRGFGPWQWAGTSAFPSSYPLETRPMSAKSTFWSTWGRIRTRTSSSCIWRTLQTAGNLWT